MVFTLKNGKAVWNFVEIVDENSHCFLVAKGLAEGDAVIVSNTLHLNHDTQVATIP